MMSKVLLPGITVVVPTYNRLNYLPQCLDSVLSQDVDGLKVVVVDDASTDGSLEYLRGLENTDSRVRIVVNSSNTGSMNKAMQLGIDSCDTEYFTWIGSDDLYLRHDALRIVVEQHALQKEIDYISFDLKFFHGDDVGSICNLCGSVWPKELGMYSVDRNEAYSPISYAYCVYMSFCPPFPWNGVWKTSFFRKNNITWITYMENTWSPDTMNGLYFFSKGMKATHLVGTPLIYYRKHKGQDTVSKYTGQKMRNDITLLYALYEWFDPESFTKLKFQNDLERHLHLLENIMKQLKLSEKSEVGIGVLEDCATDALMFMWKKLRTCMHEPKVIALEKSFREYIQMCPKKD